MKHPNPQIQQNQDDFLKDCPESEKDFHARLFRIGNAAYIYHRLAVTINNDIYEVYFEEWLEALPDTIRVDMRKLGFEGCKTILPFTRYINERKDEGMDKWMKEHLCEEDYEAYNNTK